MLNHWKWDKTKQNILSFNLDPAPDPEAALNLLKQISRFSLGPDCCINFISFSNERGQSFFYNFEIVSDKMVEVHTLISSTQWGQIVPTVLKVDTILTDNASPISRLPSFDFIWLVYLLLTYSKIIHLTNYLNMINLGYFTTKEHFV